MSSISLTSHWHTLWGRRIAIATAIVFVVSAAFPLVTAFSHDTESFPAWWGPADVGVALILAAVTIMVFVVASRPISTRVAERAYSLYRVFIHAIFALLVAFFLLGDRIVWGHCLTGFAWRYWLLLYGLPAWLTAFSSGSSHPTDAPHADLAPTAAEKRL